MKNPRKMQGFMLYVYLAVGIAIVGLGLALKVQSSRLETRTQELAATKAEYAAFVEKTEAEGIKAQAAADAKAAKDKRSKEIADAQNRDARKRHDAVAHELRQYQIGAVSNSLPPGKASPGSPDTITFDRAELGRALQSFVDATSGIAIEGSQAVMDLDTARRWAQEKP